MNRSPLRPLVALLGLLAVLTLAAVPAGAHGGDGEISVTMTRTGDQVTVDAHLTYVADGHGVPDATVTVVVDDDTPVPMEAGAEEGDYTATVTAAPGASIRVTSVEPATSFEGTAPEATATSTTDTAPTESSTTTTEATTTTVAAASTTEQPAATTSGDATRDETDDEDGDGNTGLLVGGIVAIVAAAGVLAVVMLRKKPEDTPGDPQSRD